MNFRRVKSAFEQTYQCLNITCIQVGGLWNGEEREDGVAPCQDGWGIIDRTPHAGNGERSASVKNTGGSDSGLKEKSQPDGLAFGLFLAVLMSISILFLVWFRCCKRGGSTSKLLIGTTPTLLLFRPFSDVDLT